MGFSTDLLLEPCCLKPIYRRGRLIASRLILHTLGVALPKRAGLLWPSAMSDMYFRM